MAFISWGKKLNFPDKYAIFDILVDFKGVTYYVYQETPYDIREIL